MRDDRGFATVLAAGAVAVVVLLLGVCLALGSVVATRHRAATTADLAALAGAAEAVRGQEAGCARAGQLAAENGAVLRSCRWSGWDLEVTVALSCGCLPVADVATVRARAGPVVNVMR